MGASAAALASGVPPEAVAAALRGFSGVPHRLEEVGTVGGVLYVNDSKATNVASARRALESFGGGVHAILGGSLKGAGFRELREPVAQRCRACYLIGEAADLLAEDLDGTVPLIRSRDLETAMREASEAAVAGEVVLLSPACASFDQFRDFEDRGEQFRSLVPGVRAEGDASSGGAASKNVRMASLAGWPPPPPEAPSRILDPLHRDPVPPGGRRRDGLLGELRRIAAGGHGDASYYLKRYVMLGLIGLVAMHFAARHGLKLIKGLTPILLVARSRSPLR